MWCMKNAPTKHEDRRHPRYGRIAADADLGSAMLIMETAEDQYEPIESVATINEAREIAESDMRDRMRRLEDGGEPTSPAVYRVWARDYQGQYAVICELDPATMADVEW